MQYALSHTHAAILRQGRAVADTMKLLFSCQGRLRLDEFRRCMLWLMAAVVVFGFATYSDFVDVAFFYLKHGTLAPVPLAMAVKAGLFLASLAVLMAIACVLSIKRAHDIGKPGIWLFLSTSSVGLWFVEGDKQSNRYGPPV